MKRIPTIAAYCGLYCGACPHYTATRKGLLEEFSKLAGMPPEKAACDGCRSGRTPEWCADCRLKTCTREKNLEFCGECSQYPCEKWISFRDDAAWPYHAEAGGSLATIRERGVEYWISEQEKRWTCTACSRTFTWFQTVCPACGTAVKGYVRPER